MMAVDDLPRQSVEAGDLPQITMMARQSLAARGP